MACPTIHTGEHFLGSALSQIDCHAQTIGAYGFGALASPGSPVAIALGTLLTIFIALFGLRLMAGEPIDGRDVVTDILRIGIVLTLATSWPAWRVLGYDLVLNMPEQVASPIANTSSLPGGQRNLVSRLQNADDGIVALTEFGTGRLTGGVAAGTDLGDSFHGVAIADQSGFGWGRFAFLAGVLAPLALVWLGAGILLALAPLMAGLLLFGLTRDLFTGWLRALAACALGALALRIVLGAELALLEPWLTDALSQRQSGVFTPSAPTELVAMTAAFALASFGALALVGRLAFFSGFSMPLRRLIPERASLQPVPAVSAPPLALADATSGRSIESVRALAISEAVSSTMRREERLAGGPPGGAALVANAQPGTQQGRGSAPPQSTESLGSSYRRTFRKSSQSATRRDSAS